MIDAGFQPGHTTRQRNDDGDCTGDKGGQFFYEDYRRLDDALPPGDLSVFCIWNEVCRWCAVVDVRGYRGTPDSSCRVDLVDLD